MELSFGESTAYNKSKSKLFWNKTRVASCLRKKQIHYSSKVIESIDDFIDK